MSRATFAVPAREAAGLLGNGRGAHWQKSSFSGGGGEDCVEIAHLPVSLALRESDAPHVQLRPTAVQLGGLVRFVKSGSPEGG